MDNQDRSIGPATDEESDPYADPYADSSIHTWPPYYDANGALLGDIDPSMNQVEISRRNAESTLRLQDQSDESGLAQNQEDYQRRLDSLGPHLAFVGTTVPVPITPADPQPNDQDMREEIAQNGYQIVQAAPDPYTHLIAVDHHHIEETPLSFFLVELNSDAQ
jgi:hypothetical protein